VVDVPDRLLQRQWYRLRAWLEENDVLSHAEDPSGLGGWTVGDLVAHLGLGLRLVLGITEAPEGTPPISLREYVAAYPPGAAGIVEQTQDLARELAPDLLGGLDSVAAESFAALARIETPVVVARRGPITRGDYVLTRLVELVVHGDDLARAIPVISEHPGDADAVAAVAEALAEAYEEAAGRRPEQSEPLRWIRRATGRVTTDDPVLPLL